MTTPLREFPLRQRAKAARYSNVVEPRRPRPPGTCPHADAIGDRMTEPEMSPEQASAYVVSLFPLGILGADVLEAIRADGWPDARPDFELARTLGEALWAVFSDNNDVIAADGQVVSLGTWRGSSGEIADLLNEHVDGARFHYMDFYMCRRVRSDSVIAARWLAAARLVFRRLLVRRATWRSESPTSDLVEVYEQVRTEPR
jgi:hypothetical protein